MQNLFDDQEKMTPEAMALDKEIKDVLKPIIMKYAEKHPVRQIHLVADGSIYDIILSMILSRLPI